MKRNKSSAEVIAHYFGADIATVREHRYQPKSGVEAVFSISDSYWCAPLTGAKLPPGFNWENVGLFYGREIHKTVS